MTRVMTWPRDREPICGDAEASPVGYDLGEMPLYEYACKECAHQFEALVRASETPECPACHATALERRLSVFAAHTHGNGPSDRMAEPGACGACGDPRGAGACSMN